MDSKKLVDTLVTPTLTAAAAAAGLYFILGENGNVPFMKDEYRGWVAIGGTAFAASLVANASGSYLLPLVPKNYRYADMEKRLIAPLVTGLAVYGTFYLSDPLISETPGSMIKLVGLGAGAEILAQYGSDTLKSMI